MEGRVVWKSSFALIFLSFTCFMFVVLHLNLLLKLFLIYKFAKIDHHPIGLLIICITRLICKKNKKK